jgi:uncharacterized SAM-binding protein YcdF (DUF218 family)
MKLLALILLAIVVIGAIYFMQPGGQLVINNPQKSDVIVVLAGDTADDRYWYGLQLLRSGYARHMVVDAITGITYGHSFADLAAEMVSRTAAQNAGQISICPIAADSTKDEALVVNDCLQRLQPPPRSGIITTDDYHTRRALSIFRNRLPQYQWSVAAAHNTFLFGIPWWRNREWAKTYLTETEKLVWWELFDRWRR